MAFSGSPFSIGLLLSLLYINAADASAVTGKRRSWLNTSNTILEGNLPSARIHHGLIAAESGRIYLFGGASDSGAYELLNDLFMFDPVSKSWMELSAVVAGTGPSPRICFGFASGGTNLYVLGGCNSPSCFFLIDFLPDTTLNEFYSLDLVTLTWTDLTSTVKGMQLATSSQSLTWSNGKLYLLGVSSYQQIANLYIFDPVTRVWTAPAVKGTPPAISFGLISAMGKLYAFGYKSMAGTSSQLLFSYDPSTRIWTELSDVQVTPLDHFGFISLSFRVTSVGSQVFVYGKRQDFFLTSESPYGLYSLDTITNAWAKISDDQIPLNDFPGLTSAEGKLFAFGGCAPEAQAQGSSTAKAGECPHNSLYAFDPVAQIWTNLATAASGNAPVGVFGHGFASVDNKLYVLGGGRNIDTLHSIHILDLTGHFWTNLTADRNGYMPGTMLSLGFTSSEGMLYSYGGCPIDPSRFEVDKSEAEAWRGLHSFDPVQLVWTRLVASGTPMLRDSHGFTSASGKLYVYAGCGGDGACGRVYGLSCEKILSDLHSFDPKTMVWTQMYPVAGKMPMARYKHGFASVGGKLYVHGGCVDSDCWSGTPLGDLHVFDPDTKVWTNLSTAVIGTSPARHSHGFASAGGKLYVHGGRTGYIDGGYNEFPNDLHSYDPVSQVWRVLSDSIHGSTSTARLDHGFTAVGTRLYVHGGQNYVVAILSDLMTITYPQDFQMDHSITHWRWLVSVYDWDILSLTNNRSITISAQLSLCSEGFPCALQLEGQGVIELLENTQFACHASVGCSSILIRNIAFQCRDNNMSVFQVQGSILRMSKSSFVNCRSASNGGIVQAFDLAEVVIESCNFTAVYSEGFGGVVFVYGSSLAIFDSVLQNCSARSGGGAISAVAFPDCFATNEKYDVFLRITRSVFRLCRTDGAGGALLAESASNSAGLLDVTLFSTIFSMCTSTVEGGAISVSGDTVSLRVMHTHFRSCASAAGGAISMSVSSSLSLVNSTLNGSTALSSDGGAIHLNRCRFAVYNTVITNSHAPRGGGGAFFWRGWIDVAEIECPNGTGVVEAACNSIFASATECRVGTCSLCSGDLEGALKCAATVSMRRKTNSNFEGSVSALLAIKKDSFWGSLCGENNYALYGNCVATDYWELQVSYANSEIEQPIYPGVTFSLAVVKKDAYNQTVRSDSSSLLQIRSSINGTYLLDPAVSVQGSPFVQLKQGMASLDVALIPSYSSISTVSGITILQTTPFIYFDGKDGQNDSNVMQSSTFAVNMSGSFEICPLGYVLVFDSPGSGKGPARCVFCTAGTYSVSPLGSKGDQTSSSVPSCLNCPAGGNCILGGSNVTFEIGTWNVVLNQYRLLSCPSGTQLINSTHDAQQCKPCLPTQYILNPNTDSCQTCPQGLKCNSSDVVTPGLAGSTWVRDGPIFRLVSCPRGYSVSSAGISGAFDASAQQCVPCPQGKECLFPVCIVCAPCNPGYYKPAAIAEPCTPCPKNMYGTLQGAQDLSACQSCPTGAICPDGSCAFRNAPSFVCPGGESTVGSWVLENTTQSYILVSCPAGYFKTLDACTLCPACFYCAEGFSTPCASDQYSLPGSSNKSSCHPSEFIFVLINLPIQRPYFQNNEKYLYSLANFAQVKEVQVMVDVVATGSDPLTTDITFKIAKTDIYAADFLVKKFHNSTLMTHVFAEVGSPFNGAVLSSAQVTGCIPGHALQSQPPPSTCQVCRPNFFCPGGAAVTLQCPGNSYSDAGTINSSSCMRFAVQILISMYVPEKLQNSTQEVQSSILRAVALTTQVPPERVSIVSLEFFPQRRAASVLMQANAQITAETDAAATSLSSRIDSTTLDQKLVSVGLPPSQSLSVTLQSSTTSEKQTTPVSLIVGTTIGALAFVLLSLAAAYIFFTMTKNQREHKRLVTAVLKSKLGGSDPASSVLPHDVRKRYKAEEILGKGSLGKGTLRCVVLARQSNTGQQVAIKITVCERGKFSEAQIMRLQCEKEALNLFIGSGTRSYKQHEYAVHLAPNSVHDTSEIVSWLTLEYLYGKDMKGRELDQVISELECISIARDVLAALKVMHEAFYLHRDVKPEHIIHNQRPDKSTTYKLIGFGSALLLDGNATIDSDRDILPFGTDAYKSPEILYGFKKAGFPTDIWSLGVTMFELMTGKLPWKDTVSDNMDESVPKVMTELPQGQQSIVCNVIDKALEKHTAQRFNSVDEMHEAIFACLIKCGKASYSVYISYRSASEGILAKVLFDELNHSLTTKRKHRVTVFFDFRLSTGKCCNTKAYDTWDHRFASGLLNSLCFLPLLSHGFTAPLSEMRLACKESDLSVNGKKPTDSNSDLEDSVNGESDLEDKCLRELLIAQALMQNGVTRDAGLKLQLTYPVLVGPQQPKDNSEYPRMGSFSIPGDDGGILGRPSPPTARAVSRFLQDEARFESEAARLVHSVKVSEAVSVIMKQQRSRLWDHAKVGFYIT